MSPKYQAPRGTQDVLPAMQPSWQAVSSAIETITRAYGFQRIDTPVIEPARLFTEGTGATTDIVEHEMYAFQDRGGDFMALTPEATPAICRAYLELGMASWPQPVRLYTTHPMFRYDRPQRGRYRQHTQFDCEILGSGDPLFDAEVIELLWRLYETLGIKGLLVRLNSIDDIDPRRAYVERLKEHYRSHLERLSEDSRRRFEHNPLRLLDSKDPRDQPFKEGAPTLLQQLSQPAADHLQVVRDCLDVAAIPVVLDPHLVRGLDYYNRTVFEIVPEHDERQQGTIGAGGRYDGLVEILGGPPTAGVGFGSGIERILLALEDSGFQPPRAAPLDIYLVHRAQGSHRAAFRLAGELRRAGWSVLVGEAGRSIRAQLRSANAADARVTAIIGEDELARGAVTIKDMAGGEQTTIDAGDAAAEIGRLLQGSSR